MKSNRQIKDHYPCLIVGAGIVGAGIFRDLSLHGIPTLLVDKKDFTSQTSQASSKMLHGGIRYLENFDFKLVFEALHEKNLWLKLAPHLCYEQRFSIPVYNEDKRPLWMIRCGLFLYDLLSSFQNTMHDQTNRSETISKFPQIRENGLQGAGIYSDAVVDDAKLTLEVIYDGLENKNCQAENHMAYINSKKLKEDLFEVELKCELTEQKYKVTTKKLIFATGPFTDKLLSNSHDFNWEPKLLPSKGSHLWIERKALELPSPVVLTPPDGRVIFVIPQGEKILVGTTETQIDGEYFDLKAGEEDIQYLLDNLKQYFPKSNISKENILSTFCGIRPLVKEDSSHSRGKTAREHKVFQPISNCYVILGGKYTTFRVMAHDVTKEICHSFGIPFNSSLSLAPLRVCSHILPFEKTELTKEVVINCAKYELPKTFEDLVIRRLGINDKKHWNHSESFDDFFKSIQSKLSEYIEISDEQITNF
ncbi:MAG: glycerol-3-phosphate dehydrogenase/oxidase [Oligoflexia bacterium]|nr:glycerol-3-phosphate dehydrogenase/oxidase [Oligoflexia bacterium]